MSDRRASLRPAWWPVSLPFTAATVLLCAAASATQLFLSPVWQGSYQATWTWANSGLILSNPLLAGLTAFTLSQASQPGPGRQGIFGSIASGRGSTSRGGTGSGKVSPRLIGSHAAAMLLLGLFSQLLVLGDALAYSWLRFSPMDQLEPLRLPDAALTLLTAVAVGVLFGLILRPVAAAVSAATTLAALFFIGSAGWFPLLSGVQISYGGLIGQYATLAYPLLLGAAVALFSAGLIWAGMLHRRGSRTGAAVVSAGVVVLLAVGWNAGVAATGPLFIRDAQRAGYACTPVPGREDAQLCMSAGHHAQREPIAQVTAQAEEPLREVIPDLLPARYEERTLGESSGDAATFSIGPDANTRSIGVDEGIAVVAHQGECALSPEADARISQAHLYLSEYLRAELDRPTQVEGLEYTPEHVRSAYLMVKDCEDGGGVDTALAALQNAEVSRA